MSCLGGGSTANGGKRGGLGELLETRRRVAGIPVVVGLADSELLTEVDRVQIGLLEGLRGHRSEATWGTRWR